MRVYLRGRVCALHSWRMNESSWTLETMHKDWTRLKCVCFCGVDRVWECCVHLRKMWLAGLGQ